MSDISDTICRWAWDFPVINFARNELRYCCRTQPQTLTESDLDKGVELFNSFKPVTELRNDLLRGIKNSKCRKCWRIEESHGIGPRSGLHGFAEFARENKIWPELTTLSEIKQKLLSLTDEEIDMLTKLNASIQFLEISLDNLCDLKCIYCSHHYSSQWAAERIKYNELTEADIERELPRATSTRYEDIWWQWFETVGKDAEQINFIGGEPLIIEKFYEYCNRIFDFYKMNPVRPGQHISVISNFNTSERFYTRFINLCDRITEVPNLKFKVGVSCESIGNRAQFIRSNTDWTKMTANIDRFLFDINDKNISDRFTFNLQIALNALCISDLPNFFKWVVDLQRRSGIPINLQQNQVAFPTWCSVGLLPAEFGRYIDESIDILSDECNYINNKHYNEHSRWDYYISFLKTIKDQFENPLKDTNSQKIFAQQIDLLVSRRNLNFHETFPEMVPFYNYCKQL